MRFLPILLVAAAVGIQASPLGISNLTTFTEHGKCTALDQRCTDAKADCKNYKAEGFTSPSSCIEVRYAMYAGDASGNVCDWAIKAPKCRQDCIKGTVNWCLPGHIQEEDLDNQELCCKRECCAERSP